MHYVICVKWLCYICDLTYWYCDLTYWYVWHDSWCPLDVKSHESHSYAWQDSLQTLDTTDTHVRHETSQGTKRDWLVCETWLIHMCDTTTHSYVWHDSFICVARQLIHTCDMTDHDSPTEVAWLPLNERHDLITYATWKMLQDQTHITQRHERLWQGASGPMQLAILWPKVSHAANTGWLRLVGSIKL